MNLNLTIKNQRHSTPFSCSLLQHCYHSRYCLGWYIYTMSHQVLYPHLLYHR
ncbi:hypothetical protein HAP32_03725 [Serratia fonticola]|nr:hypothetical protein HAP32_03725 [Serratia fonticola]